MEKERNNKGLSSGSNDGDAYPESYSDHRTEERRKCDSKGYTYISMVGWVCRREQFRRKSDHKNLYFNHESLSGGD